VDPLVVVPTPSGQPFTQSVAAELATESRLVFLCGRYEGIDRRVVEDTRSRYRLRELSLGDFVMSGGEVAVLAVVETVARLLPGVLGNAESLTEESHVDGLLEYPVYTKPPSWRGLEVPEVPLSGDHRRIAAWRRERALDRTAQMRPDLVEALDPATLQPSDIAALAALGWSLGADGRFRRDVPPVAH
jgi:tRNA (guanine37-N1)-methyltransferase